MLRGVIYWWLLCAALCFGAAGCTFNPHPGGSSPNERPQAGDREKLRSRIADLTFIPPTPAGNIVANLFRVRFYDSTIAVILLSHNADCASHKLDSVCTLQMQCYRWDTTAHHYSMQDTLTANSVKHVSVRDVDHDGFSDLVFSTNKMDHSGLQIWGAQHSTGHAIPRYYSDSITPRFYTLPDGSSALVEIDSVQSSPDESILPPYPKKFYRISGDFFSEAPADSNWLQYVQHIRDSTNQVFLLAREELPTKLHETFHVAFRNALAALAMLDSTWELGVARVQREILSESAFLSTSDVLWFNRLTSFPRAGGFPRIAYAKQAPQIVEIIGDFDDALLANNVSLAISKMQELQVAAKESDPLVRVAHTAMRAADIMSPAETLLMNASVLLGKASSIEPSSAHIYRTRGYIELKRGNTEYGRALLQNSLRFDSTSLAAESARNALSE